MADEVEKYWATITCPHCNHQIGWEVPKGATWLEEVESGVVKCCVCGRRFPVKCAPEYAQGRVAAEWERTGSLAKDVGGPTLKNLDNYLQDDEDGEQDDEDGEQDEGDGDD